MLTFLIFFILSPESQKFFQMLFDQYYTKMFKVAFKVLNNKHDAEDIVQESFVKIANNIETIQSLPDDKYAGYCYVVTKNTALKAADKAKKIELDLNLDWFQSHDNIEESFLINEELAAISEFIKTLKTEDQTIAYLFWYEQMPLKQIASILNIKDNNVRQRIFRIRNKIKKSIVA